LVQALVTAEFILVVQVVLVVVLLNGTVQLERLAVVLLPLQLKVTEVETVRRLALTDMVQVVVVLERKVETQLMRLTALAVMVFQFLMFQLLCLHSHLLLLAAVVAHQKAIQQRVVQAVAVLVLPQLRQYKWEIVELQTQAQAVVVLAEIVGF
jgi:hypothetical protein